MTILWRVLVAVRLRGLAAEPADAQKRGGTLTIVRPTDPVSLQTLRVAVPKDAAADDAALLRVQHDLVDRFAALPGVTSATLMNGAPMTGFTSQAPIFASDHPYAPDTIPPLRRFVRVGPSAFRVLGTALVAGREYDWTDIHGKRDVVVISENFAREYWGSAAAALGKQIRSFPKDPWSVVIGVVRTRRPLLLLCAVPVLAQQVSLLVINTGYDARFVFAALILSPLLISVAFVRADRVAEKPEADVGTSEAPELPHPALTTVGGDPVADAAAPSS